MLNRIQFQSLDELDTALRTDSSLRQSSGSRAIYIAGTRYLVDFDSSSVATHSSCFVVRSREQWQATERPDAAMELRIARLVFSPAQHYQEASGSSPSQPAVRKKTKFVPLKQWEQKQEQEGATEAMDRLSLGDHHHHRHTPRHHPQSSASGRDTRYFDSTTRRPWAASLEDFAAHVAHLDLKALIQLGQEYRGQKLEAIKKKLFCQRLLSFNRQDFSTLAVRELAYLLRPFTHPDAHSPALMSHVADRLVEIINQGLPEDVFVADMLHIYKTMVQTEFHHPCLMKLAHYFAAMPLRGRPFVVEDSLHIFRAMIMHRVQVTQTSMGQQAAELKTCLTHLYNQLDGLAAALEPYHHLQMMDHWIRLYGRYILNLPVAQRDNVPPSDVIESNFQQRLEQTLRTHLPNVSLEAEKRLPDVRLDVDLYCEPKTVIEAHGHTMHFSINLDAIAADDPNPWDRHCHSIDIYKLRTTSQLKEDILKAAGYDVLIATNSNLCKVQWIIDEVQSKQAVSYRPQRPAGQPPQPLQPRPAPCFQMHQRAVPPPAPVTLPTVMAQQPMLLSVQYSLQVPVQTPIQAPISPTSMLLPTIAAPPAIPLPPGMQLVLGADGLWHCVPINPNQWSPYYPHSP